MIEKKALRKSFPLSLFPAKRRKIKARFGFSSQIPRLSPSLFPVIITRSSQSLSLLCSQTIMLVCRALSFFDTTESYPIPFVHCASSHTFIRPSVQVWNYSPSPLSQGRGTTSGEGPFPWSNPFSSRPTYPSRPLNYLSFSSPCALLLSLKGSLATGLPRPSSPPRVFS